MTSRAHNDLRLNRRHLSTDSCPSFRCGICSFVQAETRPDQSRASTHSPPNTPPPFPPSSHCWVQEELNFHGSPRGLPIWQQINLPVMERHFGKYQTSLLASGQTEAFSLLFDGGNIICLNHSHTIIQTHCLDF